MLTHELTHVTSARGKARRQLPRHLVARRGHRRIRGHAEDQPVSDYDGITFDQRRSCAAAGTVIRPWRRRRAARPLEDAAARYGVGFLAVRRIAEKYGQAKMLDFFGRVVHDAASLDSAAPAALGASWSTVRTDCVSFIRSS